MGCVCRTRVIFEINNNLCKGCGLCKAACPRSLLVLRKQEGFTDFSFAFIRETVNCAGCAMCASVCPDIAICVYARTKNKYTLERSRAFSIVKKKIREGSGR
ncbi:MAG: ferredoxin family protein [Pedobacter sp.]